MSWLDTVDKELIITTGDGKQFKPLWIQSTRSVEYNTSEYEFPDINGTLVKRRSPKGMRYNMEIVFQGEDHLDQSEAFRISSEDSRPWVISHPMHGRIVVQPLNLNFDNTDYNVSTIKGVIVETITEDFPKGVSDPTDKIIGDAAQLDEISSQAFAYDIPAPDVDTADTMSTNTAAIYNEGKKSILDTIDAEAYFNLFNKANSAILNATSDPIAAVRAMQAMISYPFQFTANVKPRINSFVEQFNILSAGVTNLVTFGNKKVYESNAASVVEGMVMASVTNAEYDKRTDVFLIADQIAEVYDQYLVDLDAMQSDNGGDPDSYIPDAMSQNALDRLVKFAISNLFNIAINSKQERTLICESDTSVILLAHRLYGLTDDDSTIDQLIDNNELGVNEVLLIPKGKKILYYV